MERVSVNGEYIYGEVKDYFLVFKDEICESYSVRYLSIKSKDDGSKMFVGSIFLESMTGRYEWVEYNDLAIAIIGNNRYIPYQSDKVKSLLYLPNTTFVEGDNDDLLVMKKYLIPKDNEMFIDLNKVKCKMGEKK